MNFQPRFSPLSQMSLRTRLFKGGWRGAWQPGIKEATVIVRRKEKDSLLKGIPKNLLLSPAYLLAQKASQLGFDWPDLSGVLKKMDEELGEFREALAQPPHLSAAWQEVAPYASRRHPSPESTPDQQRRWGSPLCPGQRGPVPWDRSGGSSERNSREVLRPISIHRDVPPSGRKDGPGVEHH